MPQHKSLIESFVAVANSGNYNYMTEFFNGYPFMDLLRRGQFPDAIQNGQETLGIFRQANPGIYEKCHKGFAFYWIGIASLYVRDYERGLFYIDAAASEDVRAGFDETGGPDSTSLALDFLQLKRHPCQYYEIHNKVVCNVEKQVEAFLQSYSKALLAELNVLNLDRLRTGFLARCARDRNSGLQSCVTTFLTYTLEFPDISAMHYTRASDGTNERIFLYLFKGCLLLESLLKAAPSANFPPRTTLGAALNHFKDKLCGDGSPPFEIGEDDFDNIVRDAGNLVTSTHHFLSKAGRIRNTLGHNLNWRGSIDHTKLDDLASAIFSACLHVISKLYVHSFEAD